ncbi:Uncharacterised protein [Mycobacterium tuberculosis]|nr:Uncharacterised protein [Mycobacterium tuberculosis]CPA73099.1 Uncharacterised protein [Mycobacterium tuberculosis]
MSVLPSTTPNFDRSALRWGQRRWISQPFRVIDEESSWASANQPSA